MNRRDFRLMTGRGPLLLDVSISSESAEEGFSASRLFEQSETLSANLKRLKAAGCDLLCFRCCRTACIDCHRTQTICNGADLGCTVCVG